MAFESASCLTELIRQKPSRAEMPALLATYTAMRLPRVRKAREQSQAMRYSCQLPDGVEQQERDRRFKEEHPPLVGFPNPWADPAWQKLIWGYDIKRQMWNEKDENEFPSIIEQNQTMKVFRERLVS
jgi:hypothetical protein